MSHHTKLVLESAVITLIFCVISVYVGAHDVHKVCSGAAMMFGVSYVAGSLRKVKLT